MVGEYVLKKNGIDPRKDTNLIQNIEFANIANAFASGTGEFVQLFEPTASILEKEGKGYIVASFGAESGTVPYTTFMAKESFLKKDKAAAENSRAHYIKHSNGLIHIVQKRLPMPFHHYLKTLQKTFQ